MVKRRQQLVGAEGDMSIDERGNDTVAADPLPDVPPPSSDGMAQIAAYRRRLMVTDLLAIGIAVLLAYLVRFDLDGSARVNGDFEPTYLMVSAALLVVWFCVLSYRGTYDRRIIGIGPAEYHRVWSATWRVFAVVAIAAYLLRMEIGRGYLAIAFPLGLVLLLLGRFIWRQWIHRQRRQGRAQSRVLVVGHLAKANYIASLMSKNSNAGFGVVGVCVPGPDVKPEADDVPVLGTLENAARVAMDVRADTVAVVGSDRVTTEAVRQLAWDLEGTGITMAVTVPLRDVAGPRVTMQPVNGLPLVYVDEPTFAGPKYAVKTVFDWISALMLVVVLGPVLLTVGLLVKATSSGPVFYRQERVGLRGGVFSMVKFRSMRVGADSEVELLAERNDGNGALFKLHDDPRVTRIGRVLRRYSLDELPQLFNVLRGEMSLVGPRPPLPGEVAQYENHVHRRLFVKPGVTGLWQVSGRSDLSWDETVRLDLGYAENWTPFGDMLILARTVRVVLSGDGAY